MKPLHNPVSISTTSVRLNPNARLLANLAKILPTFAAGLFALLTAAPSHAATAALPLLAAGGVHSLYVTSDGKLWAMGDNSYGQLGDGTTTDRTTPVQVMVAPGVPATNVIAVAAGQDHSLYVTSDGKLWAMGDNSCGQLGDGTTTGSPWPVQVMASPGVPVTNVTAVAAGYNHSLYVTSDRKLWAMGSNWAGQLGDGTITDRALPVQVMASPGVPVANVTAVAAGGDHSLFIKSDETLWGVGWNFTGQLGNGTTSGFYASTVPTQVRISSGVAATNVIAVAAGHDHSLYMTGDGKLWAMGDNSYGQLGDGPATGSPWPVQIMASPGVPVTNAIAIAVGWDHNLYIEPVPRK